MSSAIAQDELTRTVSSGAADPAAETLLVDQIKDELVEPGSVLHDRSSNVLLDANGGFTGRVGSLTEPNGTLAAMAGLNVRVVSHGAAVGTAVTAADGTFSMSNLPSGPAALYAYGDHGFLVFGIRLVAPQDASAVPVSLESGASTEVVFSVDTALVAESDMAMARDLIIRDLSASDRRFRSNLDDIEQEYPYGDGDPSTTLSHQQVALEAGGVLKGQVSLLDTRTGRYREVVDLELHFLRNGQHVVSGIVNPDGSFLVVGLTPGVHSVVGSGHDGILAFGVELVDSNVAADGAGSEYRTVSVPAAGLSISATLANSENAGFFGQVVAPGNDVADASPPDSAPMGGSPGGGAGGGAAGGGAGGGGGGLGALLGAAAAGGIAAAIANNNNNNNDTSPGM